MELPHPLILTGCDVWWYNKGVLVRKIQCSCDFLLDLDTSSQELVEGITLYLTTVCRVQRLLETGVLKERPIWLDAVEAVPPLPPPILPEAHRTGRSLVIAYPQDKRRYA